LLTGEGKTNRNVFLNAYLVMRVNNKFLAIETGLETLIINITSVLLAMNILENNEQLCFQTPSVHNLP
jgi:hypothetical protein